MNRTERARLAERTQARAVKVSGGDFAAYRRRIENARRVQASLRRAA